jgi:hypothetical protein
VLTILLVGLIVVVVCVFPVMFTARKLNAGKADLVDCIIAIVVGAFVSSLAVAFLPGAASSALIAVLYWLVATALVYKYLLETTFVAGVIIALVPVAIKYILGFIFV